MLFSKLTLAGLVGAAATLGLASAQDVPKFDFGTASTTMAGVVGANKNGPTNPNQPSLDTPINQTSEARLVSVNSIDDWCTFSSPDGQPIANTESFTVAYCTKARNNARVIPDGTLSAVHFVKTPLYVQVMALGDFTKIGIPSGDQGGELDPHGATNMGNPVGGNVTSNVSGKDVFYEEWMNFVSYQQVCIRICIAGSDAAPTALECLHTLDEMGCNFVMPGNYADQSFDTCDGDAAYPPGVYPQGNGRTSSFQQYFSSVATVGGQVYTYVNGSPDQATPTAAYSVPATSNCVTTNTISNGIAQLVSSSAGASEATGMSTARQAEASGNGSSGSSSGSGSSSSSSSGNSSGASALSPSLAVVGSLVAAIVGGAMFLH